MGFPSWNLIGLVPPNDNDEIGGTIRPDNLAMPVDASRIVLPSSWMPGRATRCPCLGKMMGYARIHP